MGGRAVMQDRSERTVNAVLTTARVVASTILCTLLLAHTTAAQTGAPFPSKPLRYIVPFAPGGTNDIVGRLLAPRLSESLGQPVIIENIPGASGVTGSRAAARAAPDGHTLVGGSATTHGIVPVLNVPPPYDTLADFSVISILVQMPNLLVVSSKLPVANVAELIALARARPGALTFASSGHGTTQHLSAEVFMRDAGVLLTHVPYKGSGPALADVVKGVVDMNFDNISSALPQVRGGRLRAIGVTTRKRSPAAPDLPTLAEQGLPGMDLSSWQGLFTPTGAPAESVSILARETAKALAHPEVQGVLRNLGAEPVGLSGEAAREFVLSELRFWRTLITARGIRVENP